MKLDLFRVYPIYSTLSKCKDKGLPKDMSKRRVLLIHLGEQKGPYDEFNLTLCCSLGFQQTAQCIDCNRAADIETVDDFAFTKTDFAIVTYSVNDKRVASISESQLRSAYALFDETKQDKPNAKDVDTAYKIFALAMLDDVPLHVCALDEANLEGKETSMSLLEIQKWAATVQPPNGVFPDGQKVMRLRPEPGSSEREPDTCFDEDHRQELDQTDKCTVYHLPKDVQSPSKGQLDSTAICNLWTITTLQQAFEGHSSEAHGAVCVYCMVISVSSSSAFGCPYCGGKKKQQQEGMGARLGGNIELGAKLGAGLEFGACATDKTHPASYSGYYGKVKMFRD